jgi:hypothetical protein
VFWRPELLDDVVELVPVRAASAAALTFDPMAWPGSSDMLIAEDGAHLLLRIGQASHRLWLPEGLPSIGTPLTARLALDGHAAERAEAALAFWRAVTHPLPRRPAVRPLDRGTAGRILTLRALDGALAGNSYRTIAEGLFGPERLAAEPWKTSSLRGRVLRLVGEGWRLMDGGYRELLRRRMKDGRHLTDRV